MPNTQILEMGKLMGFQHTKAIIDSIETELDNSSHKNIMDWEVMIIKRFQWQIV